MKTMTESSTRTQGVLRPIAISPLMDCAKIFPDSDSNHRPSPGTVSSRQLKFGVERILSEDISPSTVSRHHDASVTSQNIPCSECVTSLLRCCRLSSPSSVDHHHGNGLFTHYSNYSTLHTPRPIRPYTNLLMPDGTAERSGSSVGSVSATVGKRKRSWSRAVFSNLQRKGLEKRFQLQKYITKPDRRQLAATLGLTDAQVKVWFQNRRMKWRHSKEGKHQALQGKDDQGRPDSTQESDIDGQITNP